MHSANTTCACGAFHPAGFICDRAPALPTYGRDSGNVHDCSRESVHGAPHNHGRCRGGDRAPAAPVDLSAAGENTNTRAVYRIVNMDCPMEEALIRKKLGGVKGIVSLECNLMQRLLTVNHELPSTEPIEAALRAIDMTPEPIGIAGGGNVVPGVKIPWKKLALAGVFAALSEAFAALPEWNASPFGIPLSAMRLGGVVFTEWLPLVFAVLAIGFSGLTTYRKGWLAIKNMNLNINALMSVAVTGAVIIGQFSEAAMVIVLFSLSEAIEAKALDRARNAIRNLLDLAPKKASVQGPDGAWTQLDIRKVTRGSRVRVKPGERVALDGIIVQGQSAVNQAPITGESMPVEKSTGDVVYAGTINESGSFEFEVTAGADDTTLARIIHMVEKAQGSRAPIQRFVDRFAKYYTPAVFLTAVLAGVIPPLFLGGVWAESIYTALVILVIGCPCALVISTPVSIVSGLAAASRSGILIKGGLFLEKGRRLTWIALDKTGTLTHGKPRQTDYVDWGDIGESTAITLAASLAARSDHPVSRAIAENAVKKGHALLEVADFTAIPGQGVTGVIHGRKWRLGNRRMVEEMQKCSPELEKRIRELEQQGKTVVALIGDRVQGLFAVADTLKDSSIKAVQELKKLGVKTIMLTGDNEYTAKIIAAQAGVDAFRGNLLPDDKLKAIEQLKIRGEIVGMVGDGINDAPALARADIGFAMAGGGADTAVETADVALMDDDLRKIPRFIRLSGATFTILVQNIILALSVKALFFTLTFQGTGTMWMAVFADVGAALIVVGNGLRAIRK